MFTVPGIRFSQSPVVSTKQGQSLHHSLVFLEVMSILSESATHNLHVVPTFSDSAGSSVPFM